MLSALGDFLAAYGWPLLIGACAAAFAYSRYIRPAAAAAAQRARNAAAKRSADSAAGSEEFAARQARMAEARDRQLRRLQLDAEELAVRQAEAASAAATAGATTGYVPGQPGQTRRSLLKYNASNDEDSSAAQQRKGGPSSGKKRLRDDYNPLAPDPGAAARYRPPVCSISSGGG